MPANLMLHCGGRGVSLAEIEALPEPVRMGANHNPVHHGEFIRTLVRSLGADGFEITRQEFGLAQDGGILFGVMDLVSANDSTGLVTPTRGISLGFRQSTNQSIRASVIAGLRIFVCDNLALSGGEVVLGHKLTKNFNVREAFWGAMPRLAKAYTALGEGMSRLAAWNLGEEAAKSIIFDAFVRGVAGRPVLPVRLMKQVAENYFEVDPEARPDCAPRNAEALHNAFTRTVQACDSDRVRFESAIDVSRFFGVGTNGRDN